MALKKEDVQAFTKLDWIIVKASTSVGSSSVTSRIMLHKT